MEVLLLTPSSSLTHQEFNQYFTLNHSIFFPRGKKKVHLKYVLLQGWRQKENPMLVQWQPLLAYSLGEMCERSTEDHESSKMEGTPPPLV